MRVRDPFGKLLVKSRESYAYTITPKAPGGGRRSMTASKRVLIIAGPNGAGKTVFATEFLPNECQLPNLHKRDLIAAGLIHFDPTWPEFGQAG